MSEREHVVLFGYNHVCAPAYGICRSHPDIHVALLEYLSAFVHSVPASLRHVRGTVVSFFSRNT